MVQREEAELIIKTPNSLTFIPSLITMELMNVLTLLFQLMFIKHLLSTRHHHVTCFTHVWLHYPMDCSLPGSSVYGTLQARILEWVTISFSRGYSQPRGRTQVSRIGDRRFNLWATREALYRCEGEVAQPCPTLCDPVDCSLPGFSIHGILQARILEWVTISFSRGYSWPRDLTQVSRIGGRHFNLSANREAPVVHIYNGVLLSC